MLLTALGADHRRLNMNLESLKKEATITSTKSLLIYQKWISVHVTKLTKLVFPV